MRIWYIGLAIAVAASCWPGWAPAQAQGGVPAPSRQQLSGLDPAEASALVAKLEEAQRLLQAGAFPPFELLSGAIASYEQAKLGPREAFLRVPFDQVWKIERGRRDNPLWQPFRLSYAPDGLGKRYWDIEVVFGVNGNIERVTMLYKPPAP
ncbi:hypothetical protein ABS767_03185 [Sphingomonas sp. ST-64]|uniref:Uncharacterized protein n=1 Tax=Sphingomonas plantiphila TaxID=3163295 RepID=A0ABW8YLE1_9SPHN